MKRVAALAVAFLALVPALARAEPLQRLTVTSFTLASDTQKPQLEVPFHVIIALHVRENVQQIDNITLPVLVDVELMGDERTTSAGPGGTDYREVITVVSHHTGTIALSPATLQAIDARDGKAKQYTTNALSLEVTGGALVAPADEATVALQILTSWFRLIGSWLIGIGAVALLVILLVRRRPKAVAPPVEAAPAPPPPPPPVVTTRTRRERLQDALTVLRADRNRPTAVRVRTVVWESIGAAPGETLADVLRRPESNDPNMAAVLRALERAAFTYDDDLERAIDGACEALERYLA
jgi:hypothetical protein